jgi:ABC-type branched-subunit amino acid transport system substrate-binding protein
MSSANLKRGACVVLAVGLATSVAACSSSGKKGDSTTPPTNTGTSSSAPTPGGSTGGGSGPATLSALKFMTMTPLSGPYGTYPTVVQGAQAAAAALNKVGGIQGHKIEIVSCDTKFDPNAAVACGRKAVSEEVVALAGSNDDTNGAYLPITQKEGIPDIGVTPNADAQAAGGLEFPIQGGSQLNQVAAGRM